jgi:branched-chain amino acid transport system ATP-binding protein
VLKVEDLEAGYAGSQVLHSISLRVGDGETVVVLGPNGHGKTTLLRAISGLVRPRAGRVEFDGTELTHLPTEQIVAAGVVHIPQGDLPFPEMTVLENLLVGAYRSDAWGARAERLERVFQLFPPLAERQRQLARSLSGGERRMLALGRGLMSTARLLMIDEPSLGLAPLVIEQVYATIHAIKRSGLSILLVDENAEHVAGLADRMYLLEAGVLVREGAAAALLRDQALLAAYLG